MPLKNRRSRNYQEFLKKTAYFINKHLKQYFVLFISSSIRGATFWAHQLGQIFLFLLWPLKKIFYLIFKYIILPVYNLLYLIKKRFKENLDKSTNNKIMPFFTHKYLLYLLVLILSCSVLVNNLIIKTAAAEDLGQKSLLYKIAQGDEFEEVIEEVNIITEENGKDKLAAKETEEIDFLKPGQTSLTKSEPTTGKLATTTLQETTVTEGLAADTLQKTGVPATFTIPQPREKIQEYIVQSGDTISSIAEKFNISINTILWANDISGLSIIRPGDKLTILPVTGVLHKIKKGDTISAVAKKYSVSQDKILSYNKLISDEQLQIGQILLVPGGEIERTYARETPSVSNIFKSPSSQRKAGGFIWPTVSRQITQYYHWRHHAIDIGGPTGSPIYASLDGKIIKAGWTSGYGYNIIIDHGGGKKTLYAHLSKIYVKVGEQVTQGATIGSVGSTGWSTGSHLHFEIIINGKKVNPLSYL